MIARRLDRRADLGLNRVARTACQEPVSAVSEHVIVGLLNKRASGHASGLYRALVDNKTRNGHPAAQLEKETMGNRKTSGFTKRGGICARIVARASVNIPSSRARARWGRECLRSVDSRPSLSRFHTVYHRADLEYRPERALL